MGEGRGGVRKGSGRTGDSDGARHAFIPAAYRVSCAVSVGRTHHGGR